nr:unnamed protein product [Digitaria exilis]
MATAALHHQLTIAAVAAASLIWQVVSGQPAAVALPGCRDKCGRITVPYPFGIGAGCYRDDGMPGFMLECDDTGRSPPRLMVPGYGVELAGFTLATGEARAYLNATRVCYNSTGSNRGVVFRDENYMALIGSHYRFSAAKNLLISLGCPNLGYFVDGLGYYISGCMSVCRPTITAPGLCTGVGCCQSTIPAGLDYYEPYILDFLPGQGDPIFIANTTTCRYVFLVESEWLNTTYNDRAYLNRTGEFDVPLVLDWAVRNVVGDCAAASGNATSYACRSALSECINSTNGQGYRCGCLSGYEGNPYLDGGCIGVGAGVFLVAFMCFWLYLGLQKRKLIRAKNRFFEQNGGILLQQQISSYNRAGVGAGAGFKIFSTEELEKATNGFAADRVLGRGGHGIVYRGVLEDKTVVAIKKSKMMEETETKEFAREMFILSQINHRNVVKLLGCCLEVEVPMLVYEFVSNGTLYHYIHDKDSNADFTLDTRLRIAAESAEALAYMHSSASPPILHGDVKTANILLDDKLTAKVSDFGTSKLAPNDEAEIATLVQGTWGYLDPEYLMTCHLTDKSDVYSFGVVLLELLTRRKALYFQGPEEDRSLVSCFVTAVNAGRHQEVLDSQASSEMRAAEILEEIVDLVMQCVSISGEERPPMKEVAERLERLRRYQLQHPWTQPPDGNLEEWQGLLLPEQQQNVNFQFNHHDALNIEHGRAYFSL